MKNVVVIHMPGLHQGSNHNLAGGAQHERMQEDLAARTAALSEAERRQRASEARVAEATHKNEVHAPWFLMHQSSAFDIMLNTNTQSRRTHCADLLLLGLSLICSSACTGSYSNVLHVYTYLGLPEKEGISSHSSSQSLVVHLCVCMGMFCNAWLDTTLKSSKLSA